MPSSRNIRQFKSVHCSVFLRYPKQSILQKFRVYSSQELPYVFSSPLNSHSIVNVHSFMLIFRFFLACVHEDKDIECEGVRIAEFFESCEDFGSGGWLTFEENNY